MYRTFVWWQRSAPVFHVLLVAVEVYVPGQLDLQKVDLLLSHSGPPACSVGLLFLLLESKY